MAHESPYCHAAIDIKRVTVDKAGSWGGKEHAGADQFFDQSTIIGKVFHEEPQVLHYGRKGTGMVLEPGMTFTIEPMINAGRRHTRLNKLDGWTVTTRDGRLSAQWEHTICVTDDGCEVLTRRSGELEFAAS